jgi:hypothetical protein
VKTTVAAAALYQLIRAAAAPFARDTVNLLEASDAAELLTVCKKKTVDLVIVPETFGGVSARNVCRTLKSLEKPPIVMIVVTSKDERVVDEMKQARADEVIVGAYDGRSLIERSAKLLGVSVREPVRILTRLRAKTAGNTPGPILLGTIIDISVSGLLIETSSTLHVGSELSAEFYLHGQLTQLIMTAKVMRIEQKGDQRHVGMRFLEQQEDQIAQIEAFVQTRTKAP